MQCLSVINQQPSFSVMDFVAIIESQLLRLRAASSNDSKTTPNADFKANSVQESNSDSIEKTHEEVQNTKIVIEK